jgi:hypothetical protein
MSLFSLSLQENEKLWFKDLLEKTSRLGHNSMMHSSNDGKLGRMDTCFSPNSMKLTRNTMKPFNNSTKYLMVWSNWFLNTSIPLMLLYCFNIQILLRANYVFS